MVFCGAGGQVAAASFREVSSETSYAGVVGTLADLSNIGMLFAFGVVGGGVLSLRYREPDRPRAFRAPGGPLARVITIITCVLLMAGLPIMNWIRFFTWLVIGLVIYYFYGRRKSTLRLSGPTE